MQRRRALGIAVGGVCGATLRWAAINADPVGAGRFPWTVFFVNIAGSALLGAALADQWRRPSHAVFLRDVVGVGFCGGLTTFSTFAVEVAGFVRAGRPGLAVIYLIASVIGAVLAAFVAAAGLRQARALMLPLEEAP